MLGGEAECGVGVCGVKIANIDFNIKIQRGKNYMSINTKKIKKIMGIASVIAGVAFIGLRIIAKKKKLDSVYANEPEQRNPLEGRKVTFVEDENDKENADGIKGHLKDIGFFYYKPSFYEKYIKRCMDIFLSFCGIVILSPIMGVIALAIKIEDPGPVFFTQKRMGQNKQYFKLHKFRSMKMCTPHDVPTHMLDNPDQYITKVGKFIRAHSLDELPQIWDIFIGNMSVIGPRPGLWNQDVLTAERDKYGANNVKPGLTGWAQINGRDELEISEKARLDGEYVSKIGLEMDIRVFLKSFHVFGKDETIIEGGTGKLKKIDEQYSIKIEERKHTYSVLMSVYKSDNPTFLKLALESIYENQTVKPDEIVIVFDGPLNEQLYSVLDKFIEDKKQVVKYFPQEKNQGLGEALRIGSQYCTGEYIFRMDSDDISDPRRFESQILYVENHPEIDALGTDIAEFDLSPNEAHKRVRSCPEKHEDIVKMGKKRNPMNHVSVCMKKSALEKCGGYQSLLLLEDYYLWLHMIGTGCKLANIHESLVYVRVGNGFDSKRGSQERITGWKVLQNYMLEIGMISRKEAFINMLYIKSFVKTPSWVKKVLYSKFLRSK